jgi:hypothetical protein
VTTLNYSFNHARSGSNSCSASLAPWLISISPLPHRHSVQPRRFSFSFAGLQAQPQPVAEIVPCGEPKSSGTYRRRTLKLQGATAADNVGCVPPQIPLSKRLKTKRLQAVPTRTRFQPLGATVIRDRSQLDGALRHKNGRFKRIEDLLAASLPPAALNPSVHRRPHPDPLHAT